MKPAIRISRKAKTISARADERRLIETTVRLAQQFDRKVIVSTKAKTRSGS